MTVTGKILIGILVIPGIIAAGYAFASYSENSLLFGIPVTDFTGFIAIGLGLGYSPILPGTIGALGGIFICLAVSRLRIWKQISVSLALILLAIPICGYGSLHFVAGDDQRIVADELLTLPVATLALPIRKHPVLLGSVFVTSRILDHTKPPPIRTAESLPGGVGIVFDDVVANIWTLILYGIGWGLYRQYSKTRNSSSQPD